MINYDNVTVTIHDYNKQKVGTLFTPNTGIIGQASEIYLTHEDNGWKELSFLIPSKVNGEDNPLVAHLINEYLIVVDDGNYKDVFVISEPKLIHNNKSLMIDATCNHLSSRLRMKKLYLVFDDTNGVGKADELAEIVLSGTGWSLGHVDKFYEADETTEKVRTLTSGGKEGAFQLINKICDLFNARPVYHGDTQTVDLIAFAPYLFKGDATWPQIKNPDSMIELNYSKGMAGVTRTLNTENMITRLYVEGSFGDNGYLGIEEVNPTGMNFLLNFDYFKKVGLFTEAHQQHVDEYLLQLRDLRATAKNDMTHINNIETRLMQLWGTANYGVYDIAAVVDARTYDVTHITSLGKDTAVDEGDTALVILDDGTHQRTKVVSMLGDRLTLADNIPAGTTATGILIYRELPSGTIGGKEVAVESKEATRENLASRIGDNFIKDSDVIVRSTEHLVRRYTLTENWQVGKQYTLQIWGDVNTGNTFGAWRDNVTTSLGVLTYDEARRCWHTTFTCPDTEQPEKNVLSIYNVPSASASEATIRRIKLEYGEIPTPWSPAEDSSSMELLAEYDAAIRMLYVGTTDSPGIYTLTREAISEARALEVARLAYKNDVTAINALEAEFADNMGDLLRDGYWQDDMYIVGQEENLYKDAIATHEVMAKPVADYAIQVINAIGMDAAPHMDVTVNSAVHIIDEDAAINTWGYISQVVYCLDNAPELSMKVSTQESRFAGQSFTQILSAIAETAKDVRSKRGVYARAGLITGAGKLPADTIEGVIRVETTRLLSAMSNWGTDENGNIIFVSQDNTSAMLLTGEGFMIADGRTTEGGWNWRTFGGGRGFSADAITAGTLQAGMVKILGTDQFVWDGDNIYIFDPTNPNRQIRMGRYDGENYGIAFTQDDGATWVAAFGFDGINLSYQTINADQIIGLSDEYLTKIEAGETYETIATVGALNAALTELDNDVRQNIHFTAGGIIIQQTGTSGGFSSRFTSTALEFYQGADKIAWFENRTLVTDNLEARRQMRIGHLMWYVAGDGSVAVKWYDG